MECVLCANPLSAPAPWAIAPDGREYERCPVCELVILNPAQRPSPSAEEARYLEHKNEAGSESYLDYLSRLANPVCDLISPGSAGIDYGCGPAEGMRALLTPRGYRITSYDPLFYPVPDLATRRFDFLLCNEAAEHFFEPAREFSLMSSIVDKGGVIGISTGLVRDREAFLRWTYRHDPTHVIFFSVATLRWLARRYDWEILSLGNPRSLFRKNNRGPIVDVKR